MPAINYNEDTEFNEALRRHGIIPPKKADAPSSPEPVREASPSLSDLDNLSDDEGLPRSVIENYRAQRMAEQKVAENNRLYGRIIPITKADYTREVTEASKVDLEGEPVGSGTGVVCLLYKDSLPDCKLLMPHLVNLAARYPSTKFVSIVSDQCIENYPDRNCPTLLVYRYGDFRGQMVGLGAIGGQNINKDALEKLLYAFRALDDRQKVSDTTVAGFSSHSKLASSKPKNDDDSQDEDNDQSFVGGGRRSGIRQGNVGRNSKVDDDDDDFDL